MDDVFQYRAPEVVDDEFRALFLEITDEAELHQMHEDLSRYFALMMRIYERMQGDEFVKP